MALTITIHDPIAFAENPILVTAIGSSISSSWAFYKITIECTVADTGQTFSYSIPRSDQSDPSAVFDLMSCALSAFSRKQIKTASFTASGITLSVLLFEEYIIDGTPFKIQSGTTQTIYVIDGGLTDMERSGMTGLSTLLGSNRILSRKPDKEIVDRRFPVVTPYYLFSTKKVTALSANISEESLHSTVTIPVGTLSKQVIVGNDKPHPVFIIFRNRFGMEESFCCESNEAVSYEYTANEYQQIPDRAFGSVSKLIRERKPTRGALSLSSGYLTPEWADWFISELLTTDQAYCKIGINGSYIPISIVTDEDRTVYDKLTTEPINIEFRVRVAVSGSLRKFSV